MGTNTTLKTRQIIAAAQALDFRDFKPGRAPWPLYPYCSAMTETVKKRDILHAVAGASGELKTY